MAGARTRLAILVLGLLALWLAFGPVGGVLGQDDVRGAVDAAGPLAPVAFVPISGLLALVLVPGRPSAGRTPKPPPNSSQPPCAAHVTIPTRAMAPPDIERAAGASMASRAQISLEMQSM